VRGITFSEEAYKKNNYKVTFGKRLNKNFAVEGSYTNYSSDEITSSMSAANGTALEAAIVALPEGAAKKSLIGLTGVTLTGTGRAYQYQYYQCYYHLLLYAQNQHDILLCHKFFHQHQHHKQH
jgi:hypothetical protein